MSKNGSRPGDGSEQKKQHVEPPDWATFKEFAVNPESDEIVAVEPYDIVGTAGAAGILGVERTRIGKWRKKGIMPPTVAELEATPVWCREHIEALIPWVEANRRPPAGSRPAPKKRSTPKKRRKAPKKKSAATV